MLALYLAALEDNADKALFQWLYDHFDRHMFGVALDILKDRVMAQDALQEAWMSIVNNFSRVVECPPEKRGGYLVSTVRNMSYNLLRHEGRETGLEDADAIPTPPPNSGESLRERLPVLILELPECYRTVLERRLLMEQSYQEIADELGMNIKTVGTRLKRGRELLIEILKREGYEAP